MIPYLYYITVDRSGGHRPLTGRCIGSGAATIDLQGIENLLRLALGWDWAFLGLGDGDIFNRDFLAAIAPAALIVFGLLPLILHVQYVVRLRLQARRASPQPSQQTNNISTRLPPNAYSSLSSPASSPKIPTSTRSLPCAEMSSRQPSSLGAVAQIARIWILLEERMSRSMTSASASDARSIGSVPDDNIDHIVLSKESLVSGGR